MQIDTDNAGGFEDSAPAPDLGGDDLRATLESALNAADSGEPLQHDSAPTESTDTAAREAPSDPADDGDAPPASWTKEAKQEWMYLSPTARAEIQRREREIQTTLSQTASARKLHDALAPYVDQMKEAGVEPAGYVENLLQWNAALRGQPAQAIAALAQQFIGDANSARHVVQAIAQRYGLDEWGMDSGMDREDPAAKQQIVHLEQRLRAQELAAAQREWTDFQQAKTPDGQPLYPYADELRADMAEAIRANPQLSFAEAHERAKWINPGVRQKLLEAEARQRAAKARSQADRGRSMALPRGRGGDGGIPTRDDLRGELREQLARTGLRVSEH